jgi:hypothetical protein
MGCKSLGCDELVHVNSLLSSFYIGSTVVGPFLDIELFISGINMLLLEAQKIPLDRHYDQNIYRKSCNFLYVIIL